MIHKQAARKKVREQKLKLAGFYDVPTHEANTLKEEIKRIESKLEAARASILISKDAIKSSGDKMKAFQKSVAASDADIRNIENEEKALVRKHRMMKKVLYGRLLLHLSWLILLI